MDYYQRLRKRMRNWLESPEGKENRFAEYLMLAPDFLHLMLKLSVDKRVPFEEKAKLVGAIAYFIMPFDLLPEAFAGVAGLADDLAISVYVIHGMVNRSQDNLVQKHWSGDDDILTTTQGVIKVADDLVGSNVLWTKLKGIVN